MKIATTEFGLKIAEMIIKPPESVVKYLETGDPKILSQARQDALTHPPELLASLIKLNKEPRRRHDSDQDRTNKQVTRLFDLFEPAEPTDVNLGRELEKEQRANQIFEHLFTSAFNLRKGEDHTENYRMIAALLETNASFFIPYDLFSLPENQKYLANYFSIVDIDDIIHTELREITAVFLCHLAKVDYGNKIKPDTTHFILNSRYLCSVKKTTKHPVRQQIFRFREQMKDEIQLEDEMR